MVQFNKNQDTFLSVRVACSLVSQMAVIEGPPDQPFPGVQTLRTQDTSDLGHFGMSRHLGTILVGLDSLVVTA